MMEKDCRLGASEHSRQSDLSSSRREEVLAANDEVDTLAEVVHGDGELIRPEAIAIAEQHVTALGCRCLLERSEARILEGF